MKNGTFEEEKYYQEIVLDGIIQSQEDMSLKKVILKLIKAIIDEKSEIDRDVLKMALDNSFV